MFKTERNTEMKSLSTAALVALAGLVAMPAMAMADTDIIHGRDDFVVESALRDNGTPVQSVEEWGPYIRAWVADADGHATMQFFDPDTLERVVR